MHGMPPCIKHACDAGPVNAAAAPISHASAGIDFRSELAQAKRKEAEASTRVAALEAKLKSSSSGFGELQASVQDLTHRLQVWHTLLVPILEVSRLCTALL